MPGWAVPLFIVIGGLFALKLAYIFATGGTLSVTRGAIFVATASPTIKAFLDALPMKPGDRMYDLGCGDGRVLRAAARRYGVEALGFEVNPLAYLAAKVLSAGSRGVRIRYGDFWNEDLGGADVVFCYLFPDVMARLEKKLGRELRPGARVASCNFPLAGWEPILTVRSEPGGKGDPIFVYRSPDPRPRTDVHCPGSPGL